MGRTGRPGLPPSGERAWGGVAAWGYNLNGPRLGGQARSGPSGLSLFLPLQGHCGHEPEAGSLPKGLIASRTPPKFDNLSSSSNADKKAKEVCHITYLRETRRRVCVRGAGGTLAVCIDFHIRAEVDLRVRSTSKKTTVGENQTLLNDLPHCPPLRHGRSRSTRLLSSLLLLFL